MKILVFSLRVYLLGAICTTILLFLRHKWGRERQRNPKSNNETLLSWLLVRRKSEQLGYLLSLEKLIILEYHSFCFLYLSTNILYDAQTQKN